MDKYKRNFGRSCTIRIIDLPKMTLGEVCNGELGTLAPGMMVRGWSSAIEIYM